MKKKHTDDRPRTNYANNMLTTYCNKREDVVKNHDRLRSEKKLATSTMKQMDMRKMTKMDSNLSKVRITKRGKMWRAMTLSL